MAYVVAPLVSWSSVRRAVSGGAGRLRREARALGIFGGSGGGSSNGRGPVVAGRGGGGAGPGGGDAAAAAAAVLTACAECGTNPAKVIYFYELRVRCRRSRPHYPPPPPHAER